MDLVCAADYLSFEDLKLKLGEHLMKQIGFDNVFPLYIFSHDCNMQEFHKECLKFIENNIKYCSIRHDQFAELPEELLIELISRDTFVAPESIILRIVLKWKEHNERSVEDMKEIIECIRLSRFKMRDLITIAEPSGLFSEASILETVRVRLKPILSKTKPRGRICKLL